MKRKIGRWLTFSLLEIFVMAHSSAQIVYSRVNPPDTHSAPWNLSTPGTNIRYFKLDVDHDGVNDFEFEVVAGKSRSGGIILAAEINSVQNGNNNEVAIDTGRVLALDSLALIDSSSVNWQSGTFTLRATPKNGNPDTAYLALKLNKEGKVYFGWVSVSNVLATNSPTPKSTITILDYAYNSTPNQPILAGEGPQGGPLPMTFLFFNGRPRDDAADLSWATTNEHNSKGFSVEKSEDGQHFSVIAFIESKANAFSSSSQYHFTDDHLIEGNNFYRLQQIDLDGNYLYSPIITIHTTADRRITLQVAPNPVITATTISLTIPQPQALTVEISDINGRLVKTLAQGQLSAGVLKISWYASNEKNIPVAAAIYYLKCKGSTYLRDEKDFSAQIIALFQNTCERPFNLETI